MTNRVLCGNFKIKKLPNERLFLEPLEFDTESISASESIPNIALSPANSPSEPSSSPSIQVKVTHNKKSLDVTVSLDRTVRELKDMLAVLTGIPPDKQKIMWSKGTCADDTVSQYEQVCD
jgi:Ubiquitin family